MKLKELSLENCEQVRQWRNECLESLRTPFPLTKEQQEQFYRDIVSNRSARARYWGVWIEYGGESCRADELIGMCGLENIEFENRRAEISIILNPEYRGKGYGEQAVDLLLEQGFMYLNMENIWGECYENNPALNFWQRLIGRYNSNEDFTWLDCTKYYQGKYWDSLWFNFEKEEWTKRKNVEDSGLRADLIILDELSEEAKNYVKNNT
jgi:RimJ/RimL family protein N-acetyltransferase